MKALPLLLCLMATLTRGAATAAEPDPLPSFTFQNRLKTPPAEPPKTLHDLGRDDLSARDEQVASPATGPGAPAASGFSFESRDGALLISYGNHRVAEYVYRDATIPRPYFAHLHAPGGIQVSRNHPPVPGQDATDHEALHPGAWLAFGDISGQDFWRNKAAIQHLRFTDPPAVRHGRLAFATENRLQTTNGEPLCTLLSRMTLAARPEGYLLIWDATFVADARSIAFGDQEEMGLGVRVATPITEKNGGLITSSSNARTAKATWGKAFG